MKVLVNGVEDTTFTWVTTGSINTTNTPVAGSIVVIKRETPTAPLVDFVDGSTLTEKLLDMSTAQSLFVAEESNDSITQLLQVDLNDNKFDGLSKAIKNVADPVNPQDAATKAWTEGAFNDAVTTVNTKASEASVSAGNALTSANNAASTYASFDDRMLGAKASDPLTDNDGNALLSGALYWNTTVPEMRVYNLATTSWITAYVPSTGFLQTTAIGSTVQAYDANTVKKNVANTFTATQVPDNGTAAVSTTSTYTFDGADQIREVTLTNAITVTFGAPTGITVKAMYKFMLKAGDTSARVFAWNAAYKFPNATPPLTAGATTNGAYDIINFIGGAGNTLIYDGHNANVG